jgi:hypothetical protein
MALFPKRKDPLSARERALSSRIGELEEKIRKLNAEMESAPHPRLRSTAYPHQAGETPAQAELILEPDDQKRIKKNQAPTAPAQFNDMGGQKLDLGLIWDRLKHLFQGTTSSNPKLFKYLAAGNIQGLRPLRYERRVLRNRLILSILFLCAVMLGIVYLLRG